MKSAAATKLTEDPTPDLAEKHRSAEANLRQVDAEVSATRTALERLTLATNLASVGDIPERSRHIADSVSDLIVACRRSPLRAAADLESLEYDLAQLQPKHVAAHEAYIMARSAYAAEIAESFRQRHLDATQSILKAVENLSLALSAERRVRSEYADASPEPVSFLLPDVAIELREADLTRWDSQASAWARRIRNFGVTA